jgi:ribosomal 30S subunit maturation factor RimM
LSKSTAPHLIGIGRLGGQDSEGWHHVMIRPEYKAGFAHMMELYLIFEENRVFYVTISDRKQSDKKTWLRFAEDGIAEERKLHREAILAISEEPEEEDDDVSLPGMDVVYQGVLLGCVVDVFFNGAQDVLVIATALDVELMVPYVAHYINEAAAGDGVIHLKNLDDLLQAADLALIDGSLCRQEDEN